MAPPSWAYQVENFDPPADEELICSICRAIFCDPVQCPCNHVYCKVCITKWLQSNKNCPVCRKRATRSSIQQVVPLIKNMIMKLTLKCRNSENGCPEKFTLEACENHMKSCQFEMVKCKNPSCMEELLRKDMENHENNECLFRSVKCSKCNMKISKLVPQKHCCIKDLKKALKEKISIIKERNQVIRKQKEKMKQLMAEIKALKEAERSSDTSSMDSLSATDVLISLADFHSNTSDSIDSLTTSESDDSFASWYGRNAQMNEDRENAQNHERSPDMNSSMDHYVYDCSFNETQRSMEDIESAQNNEQSDGGFTLNRYETVMACSGDQEQSNFNILGSNQPTQSNNFDGYSSDSIEYPRAPSSFNEGESFAAAAAFEVEELSPLPRRPAKRRHPLPALSNSDDGYSEGEDVVPLQSPKRCWRSMKLSADASQSSSSLEADSTSFSIQACNSSLEAGPSFRSSLPGDSNDSSGSAKGSKFRLRKFIKGNTNQSVAAPAANGFSGTTSAIFDRTIKLLERYNLESDPEWKPEYASHRGNDTTSDSDDSTKVTRLRDQALSSSSCSVVTSSDDSSQEATAANLLAGYFDNSADDSSDLDWQPH